MTGRKTLVCASNLRVDVEFGKFTLVLVVSDYPVPVCGNKARDTVFSRDVKTTSINKAGHESSTTRNVWHTLLWRIASRAAQARGDGCRPDHVRRDRLIFRVWRTSSVRRITMLVNAALNWPSGVRFSST